MYVVCVYVYIYRYIYIYIKPFCRCLSCELQKCAASCVPRARRSGSSAADEEPGNLK